MDEALKNKLERAIEEVCGSNGLDVRLEETGLNRIGGLVLSPRFQGMTPSERQDFIWAKIDERLELEERRRVTFLLTDTPEEYEAIRAESRAG